MTELQTRLIQSMYDSTNFSALPSKPSPTRSSAATSTEDLNSSISVQQASTVLTKTATARRILSTENLEEVDDSEEDGKSEKDVDSLELPAPSTNNASYDQPSDSSSTSSSSIRTSPDSISSKKWKSIHRKTYSDGNDSSASRSEWKILDSLGFPFSTTATTAILACPRPASGGSSSSATFPITSTSANQPSNSMKPAAVSPSRTWLPSLQIISPSAQDTAIMESTREKNFQNMFSLPKSESLTMGNWISKETVNKKKK